MLRILSLIGKSVIHVVSQEDAQHEILGIQRAAYFLSECFDVHGLEFFNERQRPGTRYRERPSASG